MLIDVEITYPSSLNLLTTDRTTVPAGQAVTIRGTKCPTGQPSASLDGQRVDPAVNRGTKGKGFTATATIPAGVTPGTHTLWAGLFSGVAVLVASIGITTRRRRS